MCGLAPCDFFHVTETKNSLKKSNFKELDMFRLCGENTEEKFRIPLEILKRR